MIPGQADKGLKEGSSDRQGSRGWEGQAWNQGDLLQVPPPRAWGAPRNPRQGAQDLQTCPSQLLSLPRTEAPPHAHSQDGGFLPRLDTLPGTTITSCPFQSLQG